jgi:hypothetical protein
LGFARDVEYGGPVDEDALVLGLKFPVDIESLRDFQPIFNGDIVSFVEFGLAVDVEGLSNRRRIGCTNELVEKGRAIGNGEEERSDMLFIFDLGNLIILGHGERVVHDFILGLAIRIHIHKLFSSKVIVFALSADRRLYFPCLGSRVLKDDLLSGLLSYHTVELQLLNSLLRLRDAFSHQVNI